MRLRTQFLLSAMLASAAPCHADAPPGFITLSAGTFMMGAQTGEPGSQGSEFPRHETTLSRSFHIQTTEVSNQQYLEAVQWAVDNGYAIATPRSVRDALDGSARELLDMDDWDCGVAFADGQFYVRDSGYGIDPDHPIQEVTWFGAVAYCDWLSLQEGLPRAYDHSTWECNGGDPYGASGYRLPTEAEWEYACRAGSETAFANGPITDIECEDPLLDLIGWYCGNAEGWTHDVGSLVPNVWGLHDMHGNVYEWIHDWYSSSYYSIAPSADPPGPDFGGYRVIRGGRYEWGARFCRSAHRSYANPDMPRSYLGFRPVLSAE